MTAGAGVPPELLRQVLEALENLACGYTGPDWRAVKDACTAALAVSVKTYQHNIPMSDNPADHFEGSCPCDPIVDEAAGTVTHQPLPALAAASGPDAGTGGKCPFCDSSPCEGLDECRSYTAMCHRQAQAKPSAPASGAAPEERDGEMDDLLREYRDLVAEQEARVADHTKALKASLAAVHLHVEQQKRAAREAGRREMGEVVCDGYVIVREGAGGYQYVSVSYGTPGPAMPTSPSSIRVRMIAAPEAPDAHP